MGMDPTDIRLTRIEDGLVALRGEIKIYHQELVKPMTQKVDTHHTKLVKLERDRWWISGAAGIVFSWIGMKFFGRG
ncbi:MAG: hypothetical protein ACXWP5_00125 [Bdellovibrionota bacterium]